VSKSESGCEFRSVSLLVNWLAHLNQGLFGLQSPTPDAVEPV